MPTLLVALLLAALALLGLGAVVRSAQAREPRQGSATEPAPTVEASMRTRAEIEAELSKLAKSDPPTEVNPGAMCYDMAMPPDRTEYVCPVCGETTLYSLGEAPAEAGTRQTGTSYLDHEISRARRLVESMSALDVQLDEHEFCSHCSPTTTDPQLILVIHYSGEAEPVKVRGVSAAELAVLVEFLDGQQVHKDEFDSESPLKDQLPTLQRLLGLESGSE